MMSRIKLWFLLAAATFFGFCGWMLWFALAPVDLASQSLEFSIRPGSTLRGATRQMVDAGVAMPSWQFRVLARANGAGGEIKAGIYQVSSGATPLQILRKITRGDFAQADILFVEGWTFRDLRAAIKADPDLKHDSDGLSEAEILTRLKAPEVSAEGMFFPDTYVFAKGSSDLAVLARAYNAMRAQLDSAWSRRTPELPLADKYEALILASIVEKETGSPADRAKIAGVFINRLRLGMRLQTDPSVIYGLGERFDGNLRKKDLVTDTPFNTYTRLGLPPHPIAMPGAAAIAAVTNPVKTDALYFVSRGDGTSEFSRTLAEHNRAVAKYQLPAARRRTNP